MKDVQRSKYVPAQLSREERSELLEIAMEQAHHTSTLLELILLHELDEEEA